MDKQSCHWARNGISAPWLGTENDSHSLTLLSWVWNKRVVLATSRCDFPTFLISFFLLPYGTPQARCPPHAGKTE